MQKCLVPSLGRIWGPLEQKPCEHLIDFPSPGELSCSALTVSVLGADFPVQSGDKAPQSLGKPGDRFSNLPRLRLPSPLLKADQEARGS